METAEELYQRAMGLMGTSPEEALTLMKQAGEQGHIGALEQLGKMYADGTACNKNIDEAIKYYTKAHLKGSVESREWLIDYYRRCDNEGKVFEIQKDTAKAGDLHSILEVAKAYAYGKAEGESDLEMASTWVEKLNGREGELSQADAEVFKELRAKIATLGDRKLLSTMFTAFEIAWLVSLYLLFPGLIFIALISIVFGPLVAWGRKKFNNYVQKAESLGGARTIVIIVGAVSVLFVLWALLSWYIILTR